ncbi:MAG TPA: glycoside hydrolase family 5 protein [Sphingomonas sp.]|nr:glycoside hydrolase family 5 protein [Sphingomonas sp.]
MRAIAALAAMTMLAGCARSAAPNASQPGFVPAAAARPRVGIALPLGKCVNMANMLEPPHEGDWGRAIAEDDFAIIKAGGFASVRLPVNFAGHAGAAPPYAIDPVFMARVRHVVDLAMAAKLNVLIEMHGYDGLNTQPSESIARFTALWRQIADAFSDRPDASVWFELANEPHDKVDNANLLSLIKPALAAIRVTNKRRPVIVGGQNYSNVRSLATLPLPDDPYIVPTFHYYDPFEFTHQGASFMANAPPVGRRFGAQADRDQLAANLKIVLDYMARSGRVPFLGEYGAYDDIPHDQRLAYYREVSSAWASIGVQSCAWGYSNSFRLRADHGWIPGMPQAIATTLAQ